MAGAARQRGETLWQSTQLPSLVEQQQGQTPPRVSRGSCAYAERACYSCRMGAALGAPLGESPGHWVRPEPGLPSVRALEPQGRRIQYATVDYMQHALTGRVLLLWLPSTCLHPARLPRPCGGPCDMLTAPCLSWGCWCSPCTRPCGARACQATVPPPACAPKEVAQNPQAASSFHPDQARHRPHATEHSRPVASRRGRRQGEWSVPCEALGRVGAT